MSRPRAVRYGVGSLVVVGSLLAAGLVGLKLVHGGGKAYPDVSTAPLLPSAALEEVVALDFPPGNVAVSRAGRVFVNYHPFAQARRFADATVFEVIDGRLVPFPDPSFQDRYQGVFGMTVDDHDRLWMTEPASLDHERTRVLAFDLATNALVFEHAFPPGQAKFAQDLRVSPDGRTVVLADTGLFAFTPASLLVLDVESKTHRTVLEGVPETSPQDWFIRTPFGKHALAFGLVTFRVGVDGIAFSPSGRTLAFATMSHDTLYEVPTAALLDPALAPADLRAKVRAVGRKPQSDGIAFDAKGNVLITDVENGGIARVDPVDGSLTTLVKDERVVWADGVAVDPGGRVLFTDSAIPVYIDPLARPPSLEALTKARPYRVWRFTP